MKTAIQFGAGNIGRGFIGMLLAQAGYRVVFADVSEVIIDRLAADQKYTVHVMDTEVEDVEITNITGIMSNGEAIIDEIAKADVLTTAVGLRVLGFIAPTIAKGIQKRIADGSREPLNIIACENAIRATSQLKEHVYGILTEEEKAYCEQYVGFADCSVDRIVPPVRSENPVDVVVEKYCEWNVEKASLKGEIPEIPGMNLADNLMAYIQRKLFTLNTGHCITAYTGILAGHKTIDQAIADPKIFDLVKAAREALVARKLSADDRLVSPLTTAMSYGLPVDKLVLGIGAALRYHNPEDAQSAELQEKIAAKGVAAAFSEISGVTDAALLEQVTKAYEQVTELFK